MYFLHVLVILKRKISIVFITVIAWCNCSKTLFVFFIYCMLISGMLPASHQSLVVMLGKGMHFRRLQCQFHELACQGKRFNPWKAIWKTDRFCGLLQRYGRREYAISPLMCRSLTTDIQVMPGYWNAWVTHSVNFLFCIEKTGNSYSMSLWHSSNLALLVYPLWVSDTFRVK